MNKKILFILLLVIIIQSCDINEKNTSNENAIAIVPTDSTILTEDLFQFGGTIDYLNNHNDTYAIVNTATCSAYIYDKSGALLFRVNPSDYPVVSGCPNAIQFTSEYLFVLFRNEQKILKLDRITGEYLGHINLDVPYGSHLNYFSLFVVQEEDNKYFMGSATYHTNNQETIANFEVDVDKHMRESYVVNEYDSLGNVTNQFGKIPEVFIKGEIQVSLGFYQLLTKGKSIYTLYKLGHRVERYSFTGDLEKTYLQKIPYLAYDYLDRNDQMPYKPKDSYLYFAIDISTASDIFYYLIFRISETVGDKFEAKQLLVKHDPGNNTFSTYSLPTNKQFYLFPYAQNGIVSLYGLNPKSEDKIIYNYKID